MKVNLIVTAAGPNSGRAIPIVGAKFLIGRDPQCHLRPASQAISNIHCAILIREGRVYAQDFGSTNGTQLNGETFTGERELVDGSNLKMGPLEFRVQILVTEKRSDSTPLPEALKPLSGSGTRAKPSSQPGVVKKPGTASKPSGVVPVPAPAPKPTPPATQPVPVPSVAAEDDGDAAAMLLGMDDDSPTPQVPEGSTVHEMTAVNADGTPVKKPDPKKKGTPSGAEMSAAANDILRKYIRRTGN